MLPSRQRDNAEGEGVGEPGDNSTDNSTGIVIGLARTKLRESKVHVEGTMEETTVGNNLRDTLGAKSNDLGNCVVHRVIHISNDKNHVGQHNLDMQPRTLLFNENGRLNTDSQGDKDVSNYNNVLSENTLENHPEWGAWQFRRTLAYWASILIINGSLLFICGSVSSLLMSNPGFFGINLNILRQGFRNWDFVLGAGESPFQTKISTTSQHYDFNSLARLETLKREWRLLEKRAEKTDEVLSITRAQEEFEDAAWEEISARLTLALVDIPYFVGAVLFMVALYVQLWELINVSAESDGEIEEEEDGEIEEAKDGEIEEAAPPSSIELENTTTNRKRRSIRISVPTSCVEQKGHENVESNVHVDDSINTSTRYHWFLFPFSKRWRELRQNPDISNAALIGALVYLIGTILFVIGAVPGILTPETLESLPVGIIVFTTLCNFIAGLCFVTAALADVSHNSLWECLWVKLRNLWRRCVGNGDQRRVKLTEGSDETTESEEVTGNQIGSCREEPGIITASERKSALRRSDKMDAPPAGDTSCIESHRRVSATRNDSECQHRDSDGATGTVHLAVPLLTDTPAENFHLETPKKWNGQNLHQNSPHVTAGCAKSTRSIGESPLLGATATLADEYTSLNHVSMNPKMNHGSLSVTRLRSWSGTSECTNNFCSRSVMSVASHSRRSVASQDRVARDSRKSVQSVLSYCEQSVVSNQSTAASTNTNAPVANSPESERGQAEEQDSETDSENAPEEEQHTTLTTSILLLLISYFFGCVLFCTACIALLFAALPGSDYSLLGLPGMTAEDTWWAVDFAYFCGAILFLVGGICGLYAWKSERDEEIQLFYEQHYRQYGMGKFSPWQFPFLIFYGIVCMVSVCDMGMAVAALVFARVSVIEIPAADDRGLRGIEIEHTFTSSSRCYQRILTAVINWLLYHALFYTASFVHHTPTKMPYKTTLRFTRGVAVAYGLNYAWGVGQGIWQ
jgi:hypothetical protein